MNSAAYTQAKKRLSLSKIVTLVKALSLDLEKDFKSWRFKGRNVLLGDGTVVTLEDTDDIKKVFHTKTRTKGGVFQE
mgnify:CR=1 FL=1